MTRTKLKARRPTATSTDDDADEEADDVMEEEYEVVENQQRPLESNDEIEITGNFEEVDYVVNAVMQAECCDFQTSKERTMTENSDASADSSGFNGAAAEEELEPVMEIVEPAGQTLAQNLESGDLDNGSADPPRSCREAAEAELEPPSNGVCLEECLMNDECPSTEVKDTELPNRCADDGVIDMDEEEDEGQEMLEEMKRDDCESDEKSKDGVANELPLKSVENQESQVDRRNKLSLQVRTVYIEGAPESWNADKLRDICEQFGEIKNVEVSRNLNRKGQDFGFVAFTTREYALACVEGINGREFEENPKVKAYIARPLNRKWFPKVNHAGFKRKHKHTAGLKTTKTDRTDVSERQMRIALLAHEAKEKATSLLDKTGQDVPNILGTRETETQNYECETDRTEVSQKANVAERQMRIALLPHEAKEKATSLLDKTGQDIPNILGTRESETQNYECDIPLAAEVGMPSRQRKNRKRKQRNRGKDMRASTEQKGQDVPNVLGTGESEKQKYEGDTPLAAEVGKPSRQRKNRKRKQRNRGKEMRGSTEQRGQDVPNVLGTRESETQKYEGDTPLAAEVGMPSRQRKNRKRKQRNRGKDMRASTEQKGQDVPNVLGTRESETHKYEGDTPLAAEVGMPSRQRKNRKRKQRNRGKDVRASKEQEGQDVPNVLGTRESETQKYEGDNPPAAEVGIHSRGWKNRKRKLRNRGKDVRASEEQKGYSQEQTGVSSTEPRRKSHLRKRQKRAAVSTSTGPKPKGNIARQVHIPVHRSENIYPEMEHHARYIRINEQHNPAGGRVPAFRHRQPHAVNARQVIHKGGRQAQPRPHSSFQENFAGNDALPHAGYVELVGQHHFSNHVARHNGRGYHGFAYTGRM